MSSKKKRTLDQNKVVHLWYYKRQQIKNKRRRNLLRRIAFILLIMLLNGALVTWSLQTSSPGGTNALQLDGLMRLNREHLINSFYPDLSNKAYWLITMNRKKISQTIKEYNPLISAVEVKPILFPPEAHLQIYVQEELPWARFSNGWLLTSNGKLLESDKRLDLDQLSFASQALLISNDSEFKLWEKEGKNLQKLIYSVSSQFPQMPLKSIILKKEEPITLHFNDFDVSLGYWDENILDRAARLSSIGSVIQKYQDHVAKLDLSDNSLAKLELKGIKKEN